MGSKVEGVYDFVAIGELADTIKQIIALNLTVQVSAGQRIGIEKMEQLMFQQARDYLGQVREGFVLSVRSADVADKSELQFLLERVLLDWASLQEDLGLTNTAAETAAAETAAAETDPPLPEEERLLQNVRGQLLAFGMAAIALGTLPRLPKEAVTFPVRLAPSAAPSHPTHSRQKATSYADIPVPQSPGEMLHRIEEMEQMIWQLSVRGPSELATHRYSSLRRTYGFFESSAYLARQESERFGIRPARHLL